MNKQTLNRVLIVALLAGMGFTTISAIAKGPSDDQQYWKRLQESRQKLEQAEAAKGEERQKLMDEHMKMLHETMQKCAAIKPKASMSEQERDEWYSEHQKLMDQMMSQMMEEHHMMMGKDCMSMGSGDTHTH